MYDSFLCLFVYINLDINKWQIKTTNDFIIVIEILRYYKEFRYSFLSSLSLILPSFFFFSFLILVSLRILIKAWDHVTQSVSTNIPPLSKIVWKTFISRKKIFAIFWQLIFHSKEFNVILIIHADWDKLIDLKVSQVWEVISEKDAWSRRMFSSKMRAILGT